MFVLNNIKMTNKGGTNGEKMVLYEKVIYLHYRRINS